MVTMGKKKFKNIDIKKVEKGEFEEEDDTPIEESELDKRSKSLSRPFIDAWIGCFIYNKNSTC